MGCFGKKKKAPRAPREYKNPNQRKIELGDLSIHILNAKNLPKADLLSSDPYIKVNIGDETGKTTVIKGNLNPVWKRNKGLVEIDFGIVQGDEVTQLSLVAMDWDRAGDHDKLGEWSTNAWEFIEKLIADQDAKPARTGNQPGEGAGAGGGFLSMLSDDIVETGIEHTVDLVDKKKRSAGTVTFRASWAPKKLPVCPHCGIVGTHFPAPTQTHKEGLMTEEEEARYLSRLPHYAKAAAGVDAIAAAAAVKAAEEEIERRTASRATSRHPSSRGNLNSEDGSSPRSFLAGEMDLIPGADPFSGVVDDGNNSVQGRTGDDDASSQQQRTRTNSEIRMVAVPAANTDIDAMSTHGGVRAYSVTSAASIAEQLSTGGVSSTCTRRPAVYVPMSVRSQDLQPQLAAVAAGIDRLLSSQPENQGSISPSIADVQEEEDLAYFQYKNAARSGLAAAAASQGESDGENLAYFRYQEALSSQHIAQNGTSINA